ncbi:MAG TPA: TonB-dependent receptor [Caldimonas sp.]|nr:TonB-dependent receptor [Caldimonas sp.]
MSPPWLARGVRRRACAMCALLAATPAVRSADPPLVLAAELERVTVTSGRPTTMPLEIPTTVESVTGGQIEKSINATDAEDALKYLPSLSVRKRYIGDHDHAVLATRASGSGNSARSLVYADAILLSNLLGNGAGFTPRWGLVTPEEIERVDVFYGPFSAAYPGNSGGAIVDYVTRMPNALEAHAKLQGFTQPAYRLYGTDDHFGGGEASASIGSRTGSFSWWLALNRLASEAQPVSFVVKNLAAATSAAGVPVTGAVFDRNPKEVPGWVLGSTTQTNALQDHAKLKLSYDLTPTLRASYTLGRWKNDADRGVDSYLRDAGGATVTSGATPVVVNIDGRAYAVLPTDFARTKTSMEHVIQGVVVKSSPGGEWDVEASASVYDFARDIVRAQVPNATAPSAGRITDQHGTGWNTLAVKGTWRPRRDDGEHTVEFGAQRDAFALRTLVSDTPDWNSGEAGARFSAFTGRTTLSSLWGQDAWRFAADWRTVLGLRIERWRADDGTLSDATTTVGFAPRSESHVSPKAAVSFQASDAWLLRASLGRAVRMPTVSELFQGSISATDLVNNDPNLKPEKSWTAELTAERALAFGSVRATLFGERTEDALYSQVDVTAGGTVATIQNVDRIRTLGLELAGQGRSVLVRGLDVEASLTYADSKTTRNDSFPASVGKWQPRVPRWRASLLASYAPDEHWSGSLGVRYSGRQYGQLDNSDTNGFAFTGFSRFFVADVRLQYRFDRQWRAALGIDNLNNDRYWAFHPYPQRTFHAELRFDL